MSTQNPEDPAMADAPEVIMDIDDVGEAVVRVGEAVATTLQELVSLAPELGRDETVGEYADLANHLSRGFSYTVIHDVDEFIDSYKRQRAAEDADEEVGPGEVRLSNYEVPNLDAIHAPRIADGKVIFFARHSYLRIPYRAEVSLDGQSRYEPV